MSAEQLGGGIAYWWLPSTTCRRRSRIDSRSLFEASRNRRSAGVARPVCVGVFWRPDDLTADADVYTVCQACGLRHDEITEMVEKVRHATVSREKLIDTWDKKFAARSLPTGRECVAAIVDAGTQANGQP